MASAEETYKIAANTRFAVLGRALADARSAGQSIAGIVAQLAELRKAEHQKQGFVVRIAALARQIGDASGGGQDTTPLLDELDTVVSEERHGWISEEQAAQMRQHILDMPKKRR